MPLATTDQVSLGQELEKGFDPATAKTEADRCLQCGLICYLRENTDDRQHAEAVG
jgi:hypothetical protein